MKSKAVFVACVAALGMGSALAADPARIDWSKVPATDVPLLYPGQSSYQWLRSEAHKGAWEETKRGDSCVSCHDEEDTEKDTGENLVKGGKGLEPTPIAGKNGFINLKVQAAYDDKNAYLRFQWKTNANKPGVEYPYYRFDGKEWKVFGAPRLDKAVVEGKQPPLYEDRLSIMLDDGKVPMFAEQGCWITCHDGERDMPKVGSRDEAQKALKRNDVRKYLPLTRNDPMDWRTVKSDEEIAKLKAEGGFLDLMQWRAHRSNPIGKADDGYVLHYRLFDAGKNVFASNLSDKKIPKLMFDPAKAKGKAVTELGKGGNFLIAGVNAVPFDPAAGWKEGDMLPRYYLQPSETTGSAADNNASGEWKDGTWTVVMVRPLGLTNDDDKALQPGRVYNVGFAVHDDMVTTRGHQVSWVKTLGFGVKADIQAVKLR